MAAGIDPTASNPDGFPLDVEDVEGAKGTGPTGEGERDDEGDSFDFEGYQNAIGASIAAAGDFIDMEVSPDREMLARYYLAEPFGDEQPGRSQIVVPEVRAAVLGHMTGLTRLFCGTERYIEFEENPGTPLDQADAQTDYVTHVIMRDNAGYQEIQSALDNACRRRAGILTWWWEEKELVTRTTFTGLDENAFALLQMEAQDKSDRDENIYYEIEITEQTPDETQDGGTLVPPGLADTSPDDVAAMEALGQAPPQMFVYSGVLTRRFIRKRARFRSIPPEEFILSAFTSADLDKHPLVGTREERTISELVALGFDEDEIRDALDEGGANNGATTLANNPERQQRMDGAYVERIFDAPFADVDPSSEKLLYCEVYVLIDRDGDGIAERRKICTVGDNHRIIYDEIWEDDTVPFAIGCPYPEPHSPFGLSVADMAMDIQEVKSQLMRGTLDSLSESILTRLAFWQGKVNIDDLMNSRRGAAIRTTDVPSNVIQNLAPPFVGANSLPVIAYMDEEATRRSGKNAASPTGFDPDSVQSTSREAVGSMIDASNERTEYIARNLAETMFARLYRGVRNLLLRNQDHKRVIRLRGEDVTFDPRSWLADLDVAVLIGTGRTSGTKKVMALQQVLAFQKETYEKYGPNNPVVSLVQIANCSADIIRAMGFSNPNRYMGTVTPEVENNLKAMAAEAAKKPTPEQLLAEVQRERNMLDFQSKIAKIKGDMDRAILADDQKRDKAEQDFAIAVADILGNFGIAIDEARVREAMAQNDQAQALADQAVSDNQPPAEAGGSKPEAAK